MKVKTIKRSTTIKATIELDEEECKDFLYVLNRAILYDTPDPGRDKPAILALKLSREIYLDHEAKGK